MEIIDSTIKKLEESNYYVIKFQSDSIVKEESLFLIRILHKFQNSSHVLFVDSNEKRWLPNDTWIWIYDHISSESKLIRSLKLEKIKDD